MHSRMSRRRTIVSTTFIAAAVAVPPAHALVIPVPLEPAPPDEVEPDTVIALDHRPAWLLHDMRHELVPPPPPHDSPRGEEEGLIIEVSR
jgi:hypothetical protein